MYKNSIIGGLIMGLIAITLATIFSWGYYSESEGIRYLAIILNLPIYMVSIVVSSFEYLAANKMIYLIAYLVHFFMWWVVYAWFKQGFRKLYAYTDTKS